MNCDWKGVFPALTTPFREDFQIDYKALRQQIDHQLRAGVHGLVLAGTLGEGASLSSQEKLDLVGAALDAVNSRVPVLLGLAETTTEAACQLAKKAEAAGVAGLMVLPPMLYASDSRETIAFLPGRGQCHATSHYDLQQPGYLRGGSHSGNSAGIGRSSKFCGHQRGFRRYPQNYRYY